MKKIIAGGGLILNEKNELLMIFRRGKWDLPKGKLEEGETIEQCAVREVKEETGIENLELIKFISITHHEYFDQWIKENVVKESHWFLMQSSSKGKLIPQTIEDITEIKWMNENEINDALKNSYPSIIEIISAANF
jgi:mutator protein MutT